MIGIASNRPCGEINSSVFCGDPIVHGDVLTLLNAKDREVVVLLSAGVTKLREIAHILGYANHSPISKRLARIRRQAETFFDDIEIARIGRYRGPRWGGEQEQARGLVDTDSTKKTYTTQEHSCLPFHPLSSTPSGASLPP